MTRFIALISKDLRLLIRDRLALALMMLAPIAVISVAGFSLSTIYRTGEYLLPVTDEDGGDVAREIVTALNRATELTVLEVPAADARELVRSSPRAGAALVIPAGFTDGFRAGKGVALVLWTDPVKHLEVLAIRAAVERVRAGLLATQIAARVSVVQVLTYGGEADFELLAEDSSRLAERLLEHSLELKEASVHGGPLVFNTFDQNVPGFSVTFLMLGMLFGVGLGLLDEREWGMLYRLAAGPAHPGSVAAAKVASRFLTGVFQMTILFVFGRLAFGISLGSSLILLGLVILGISFAAASFGLLVAALAPSRDSVLPLGTIAIVVMAAVGGCWWPITIEPVWLQRVAHIFPTAWAMSAFNDVMLRGRGFSEVWPTLLALVAFGSLYLTVGTSIARCRELSA